MVCEKCHGEIADNVLFCPLCGEPQGVKAEQPEMVDSYLCCPRCGSEKLNIMGDRDINSAIMSGVAGAAIGSKKVGIVSGVAGLQGRTFFVCMDCGKKFRSPDELKSEIETFKQKNKILKVLYYIIGLCGATMLLLGLLGGILGVALVMAIPCFAVSILIKYSINKKINGVSNELKEIEEGIRKYMISK